MSKKMNASIICALVVCATPMAMAEGMKVTGQARIRTEAKTDGDYNSKVADRTSSTTSRFRLNFSMDKGNYGFFFQPQFTKTWGATDGTWDETDSDHDGKPTSGALNDTELDVHQAYMTWNLNDKLSMKAGRQEMIYGDHLVVGSVGWHNTARSFDAVKFTYKIGSGKLDLFKSKLVDENIKTAADGDSEFNGIYWSGSLTDYAKTFDLYVFDKADHTKSQNEDTYTMGIRIKSKIQSVDYRFEYSAQKGRKISGKKYDAESQFDVELGYTFDFLNTRLAGEYFMASKNYDQMFPTAHKWLGFADQFARRNVKGYVVHLKTDLTEKITFKADYHAFKRLNTTQTGYNFGGKALGTVGTSDDMATELDLGIVYKVEKGLTVMAGTSFVTPGSYLKDQSKKDKTKWSYLQIIANF